MVMVLLVTVKVLKVVMVVAVMMVVLFVYLSEGHVVSIQPGRGDGGDEKLAAIGVGACGGAKKVYIK